jgi:outer membrane immunogenic protein
MRPQTAALSLVLLAAPFAGAASAQAPKADFTGSHAEIVGGWDQTDIGPNLPAREGVVYGVALGHDWMAGDFRVGLEGEFGGSSVEGRIGGGTQRIGRSVYAGARLGLPVARRVMLYVKGGYANGRFSGPVSYTGDGWRVGGGGEFTLGARVFLRTEFRYSDYSRTARGQQAVAMLGLRF